MAKYIMVSLFGRKEVMKKSIIIAVIVLIAIILTGCDGRRYELTVQVDQLLSSPTSEWVDGNNGKFYCKIPNGAVRVRSNGAVDLITDLEGSNYSIIAISNPDGTRAAKVAKRFGKNKLSKEIIGSTYAIQDELINDAIVAISNSLKSSVVYETPDGIKE